MNKSILILILIVLLALAFRLPAIFNSKSFWFDEMVSVGIAKKGIIESWQYLQWENNPPAHYWFLHFWIKGLGESEIMVRLSSLLFSILGVIAMYFFGKKIASERVGLTASFLLAISVFQISLSQDARMYPMLLLFAILSCYYFWDIIYGNGSKKEWFLYILFTVLAYYTHIIGLFLFGIQNLYFIYHYFLQKDKKLKRLWIYSQAVSIGLFIPWLYFFIIRSIKFLNSEAWYFNTEGSGFFLLQIPRSFLFLGDKMPMIEFTGLVFFTILLAYSFIRIRGWAAERKEFKVEIIIKPAVIFCWLFFLVPLMAGFIIQLWVIKYYVIACAGFFLLAAMGISNLKIKNQYRLALIGMILAMCLPYNIGAIGRYGQHQWENTARYVEQQEKTGDKIIIPAFVYKLPFDYYYRGNIEVIGCEPKGLEDDLLLKAVKYNWHPIINKENMPDIEGIVGTANRVILVYPGTVVLIHRVNLVLDWFMENNWHLESRKDFGGFSKPEVLIFGRE